MEDTTDFGEWRPRDHGEAPFLRAVPIDDIDLLFPERGQVLGDYEVLNEIEAGGLCRVIHAIDRRDGAEVALKVLDPSLPESGHYAEHEHAVLSCIRHENIVQPHAEGYTKGCWLALEYLPIHYSGLLSESPYVHVARYARDVANALSFLHERGLVHRDVKPKNTAGKEGWGVPVYKLLDFNFITVEGDRSCVGLDARGKRRGTRPYMPPLEETVENGVTSAYDVYALGKSIAQVVFETVGGVDRKRAVKLVGERDDAVIDNLLSCRPPQEIYWIIRGCLNAEPKQRLSAEYVSDAACMVLDQMTRSYQ